MRMNPLTASEFPFPVAESHCAGHLVASRSQ